MVQYVIFYIEIERQIDFYYQMQHVERRFELQMSIEGIITAHNRFAFQNVHDISHKQFSSGLGILYLHTNQGVFSYKIKENPSSFIDAFKSLKADDK